MPGIRYRPNSQKITIGRTLKDILFSFVLYSALSAVIFDLCDVIGLDNPINVTSTFLSLRYVQLLWSMEFAETHIGRPHSLAFDKCSDDLQVCNPKCKETKLVC